MVPYENPICIGLCSLVVVAAENAACPDTVGDVGQDSYKTAIEDTFHIPDQDTTCHGYNVVIGVLQIGTFLHDREDVEWLDTENESGQISLPVPVILCQDHCRILPEREITAVFVPSGDDNLVRSKNSFLQEYGNEHTFNNAVLIKPVIRSELIFTLSRNVVIWQKPVSVIKKGRCTCVT